MKVICLHNNHEIYPKSWTPGNIYNIIVKDGVEFILDNKNKLDRFEFVKKLNVSFEDLRTHNLKNIDI